MNLDPWLTTCTPLTVFLLLHAENNSFPVRTSHSETLLPPHATKVSLEGKRSIASNGS